MTTPASLAGIVTAAGLCYCPGAFAQFYNATPISIPDSVSDYAIAVNDSGIALGVWVDSGSHAHAYTYQAGVVTKIDYPGSIATFPAAINTKGDVSGYYVDSAGDSHGFILRSGIYRVFNDPNAEETFVTGLNNADVVCGYGYGGAYGNSRAAYVFKHGKASTFATQNNPIPAAINNKGAVIGNYETDQGTFGYVYDNGVLTTLLSSLGTPYTTGINNKGTVVGAINLPYGQVGFYYRNGKLLKYNVPGSSSTVLNGINDGGAAVGQYIDRTGNQIGFVVTGRLAIHLSVAQSTYVNANAISNAGEVVGSYLDNGFNTRSFIALPE